MEVIDNYIQIGPNSMIEAGTKQKKKIEVFEIMDADEIDKDILILSEQMKSMIHQSKNISIEEKGKLIQMMYD